MLEHLEPVIEAILFTAGEPVTVERLQQLLGEPEKIPAQTLRTLLETLASRYQGRGVELVEVAGGYRFQARAEFSECLQKLHARKSMRYSRTFLETLALIAYRQPLTRGEIEEIRGVAVSTAVIKSLLELEWIRVVGQRDVPGKPSLYATTSKFLDDFNLRSLAELPVLQAVANQGESS
jgi:segregation and condensation protein B